MKPLLQVILVPLLLLAGCADRAAPGTPAAEAGQVAAADTVWLFDGETFEGWNGVNSFFGIQDGAIVAGALDRPVPQNEFLCTDQRYSDFRLHLQTRLVGRDANAGIQLRTERIPDSNEVIGYQADMGIGWWGSLYDEMRRQRLLATADPEIIDQVLNIEGWNDYVIEAQGPRIQLWLNGARTVDYTEEDTTLVEDGHICVQIHSGPPGQAWYRSIWLEAL